MLDIVIEMMLCQGSGSLGKEEEGRGAEEVYKGYAPMAVNLQMAYPSGSGDGVVAEDRHVRESLVGATASGVINMAEVRRQEGPFLIRMRVAEVNAEKSRSTIITSLLWRWLPPVD
jgi:hypothetical protein